MVRYDIFADVPESFAMDPDFGAHKDLRSPSIPRKRRREDSVKYYRYRAVHPSDIGQEYYALNLVSTTVHSFRVKPRTRQHKAPSYHITHVFEKDEPALLEELTRHRLWDSLSPWRPWLSSVVPVATAQAMAKAVDIDSYPFVIRDTQSTHSDTESDHDEEDLDLANPGTIERIPINPPGPFPEYMPTNLNVKLRVKKWTKRDNFDHKEYFDGGPDIRHHRGKRRVREKHNHFAAEKELGRGTKQKQRNLQNEIVGYYRYWGRWAWTHHDDYRLEVAEVREEFREAEWACYMTWEDWEERDLNWDLSDFYGSNLRDINGDAWDEEQHMGAWWWAKIDQEKVMYKVVEWRAWQCDYEGMAELEDEEEWEEWVEEERVPSTGPDVVDVDFDEDIDAMSDVAEVIVQEEWDMLSRTSSNTSDGFVLIQ